VIVVPREAGFCRAEDGAERGSLLKTAEHHQQRMALIAGVTTRGGHVIEADRIGKHRQFVSLARKLGEIPTNAAQRVQAVRPAGSTGEAGSTRGDRVQYDKDSTCSDVVRLRFLRHVQQACACGSVELYGFDSTKGVDRLTFGCAPGTKEGQVG